MMLYGNVFAEFRDFEVIVNNQEGTMLTSNELVQGTSVEFGVSVASCGIGRCLVGGYHQWQLSQ